MDLNATIVLRNNFLLVRVTGTFTLNRVKQIIPTSIQKAQQHGLNELLYDIRSMDEIDPALSTIAAGRIGHAISRLLPKTIHMAVLVRPERLTQYKFAEGIMRKNGVKALFTADYRRALRWMQLERENVGSIDLRNILHELKRFVSFDASGSVPELN